MVLPGFYLSIYLSCRVATICASEDEEADEEASQEALLPQEEGFQPIYASHNIPEDYAKLPGYTMSATLDHLADASSPKHQNK